MNKTSTLLNRSSNIAICRVGYIDPGDTASELCQTDRLLHSRDIRSLWNNGCLQNLSQIYHVVLILSSYHRYKTGFWQILEYKGQPNQVKWPHSSLCRDTDGTGLLVNCVVNIVALNMPITESDKRLCGTSVDSLLWVDTDVALYNVATCLIFLAS